MPESLQTIHIQFSLNQEPNGPQTPSEENDSKSYQYSLAPDVQLVFVTHNPSSYLSADDEEITLWQQNGRYTFPCFDDIQDAFAKGYCLRGFLIEMHCTTSEASQRLPHYFNVKIQYGKSQDSFLLKVHASTESKAPNDEQLLDLKERGYYVVGHTFPDTNILLDPHNQNITLTLTPIPDNLEIEENEAY